MTYLQVYGSIDPVEVDGTTDGEEEDEEDEKQIGCDMDR